MYKGFISHIVRNHTKKGNKIKIKNNTKEQKNNYTFGASKLGLFWHLNITNIS